MGGKGKDLERQNELCFLLYAGAPEVWEREGIS